MSKRETGAEKPEAPKCKWLEDEVCCNGDCPMVGDFPHDAKIEHDGKPLELCSDTVFHYCDNLQQVHEHYSCNEKELNRFFEIEVLGEEVTDGQKCGSDHIKIVREITGNELAAMKGMENGNTGLFNTGDWNTGNRNTGNGNTGDRNTGNWNTDNWNTGNRNTGYGNTGDGNTIDGSNGVFCTEPDMNIRIFNRPSGMSLRDFYRSRYYEALCNAPFLLTEWIPYTEEEKKDDPKKEMIGGYLKEYTMKEAWANWWGKMSEEAKKIVQDIPNFDAKIFKEITGIEVNNDTEKE